MLPVIVSRRHTTDPSSCLYRANRSPSQPTSAFGQQKLRDNSSHASRSQLLARSLRVVEQRVIDHAIEPQRTHLHACIRAQEVDMNKWRGMSDLKHQSPITTLVAMVLLNLSKSQYFMHFH